MAEEKGKSESKNQPKDALVKPATQAVARPRSPLPIGLVPANIDDAWRLAQHMANSELVPRDFQKKPENVLVAVMWGAELGFKPMAAIQNIAVINGRPSVWGDLALAIVMSHPDYEDHKEWSEGTPMQDDWTFFCEVKRKGKEPCKRSFSVADAKRSHLWMKKGKEGGETPWCTYPQRMLAMRARSWALRDRFPDALKGLSVAEEAMDMDIIPPTVPGEPEIQMPRRVEQEAPLTPRSYTQEPIDAREVGASATIEEMATGQVAEKLAGEPSTTGAPAPTAGNEGGAPGAAPPVEDETLAVMQQAQGMIQEIIPVEQNASTTRRDPEVEEKPRELTYEKPTAENKPPKGSSGAAFLGPVEKREKPVRTLSGDYKRITGTEAAKIHKVLNVAKAHTEEEFYKKLWKSYGVESTLEIPAEDFKKILGWAGGEALKVK